MRTALHAVVDTASRDSFAAASTCAGVRAVRVDRAWQAMPSIDDDRPTHSRKPSQTSAERVLRGGDPKPD